MRGASPAGACQQLGITQHLLSNTLEHNSEFRQQFADVKTTLTQNVETALYQAAMKGNVAAQKYWLERHPPPSRQQSQHPLPKLDEMTVDELLRLAEHLGINLTLRKQHESAS